MVKINHKSKRFWFWLVLGLLFTILTIRYYHFATKRHFGDFHVYYETGKRILAGESIYVDNGIITPFKYSPIVASFFALLAFFGEGTAAIIWHILNLIFLAASVFVLLKLLNGKTNSVQWGVLGVLGISPAVIHCLNSGQVGLLILFFFVMGFYFANKSFPLWAGFFLALSAMFKFLPLLVLPYFIFKRKWKLVFYFLFWFVAFHLIPAVWFGFRENIDMLKSFLPHLTSTTLDHVSLLDFKNQSLWAYLYRLIFYDLGFFEIRNQPRLLTLAGVLFLSLFYMLIFYSKKGPKSLIYDGALLSILIVIFNPNAWKHNFVLLLYPYLLLLSDVKREGWKSWKAACLALTTLFMLGSNKELIGWGVRFELMSFSVLFLASLILFSGVFFAKSKPLS